MNDKYVTSSPSFRVERWCKLCTGSGDGCFNGRPTEILKSPDGEVLQFSTVTPAIAAGAIGIQREGHPWAFRIIDAAGRDVRFEYRGDNWLVAWSADDPSTMRAVLNTLFWLNRWAKFGRHGEDGLFFDDRQKLYEIKAEQIARLHTSGHLAAVALHEDEGFDKRVEENGFTAAAISERLWEEAAEVKALSEEFLERLQEVNDNLESPEAAQSWWDEVITSEQPQQTLEDRIADVIGDYLRMIKESRTQLLEDDVKYRFKVDYPSFGEYFSDQDPALVDPMWLAAIEFRYSVADPDSSYCFHLPYRTAERLVADGRLNLDLFRLPLVSLQPVAEREFTADDRRQHPVKSLVEALGHSAGEFPHQLSIKSVYHADMYWDDDEDDDYGW